MRRFGVKSLCVATITLFLAVCPLVAAASDDPWYQDMRSHWSYDYVRTLWEEGVTDGCISYLREDVCSFYPDSWCTRGQLLALLCKVFALPPHSPEVETYPDVPKSYRLFWNSHGWPYIEGAYLGGISFVPAGHLFRPNWEITREDAVEFLIRALDLEPYAQSLTPAQVNAALVRFYDYAVVTPARRPSMACATIFGIIKGFEDGSIRPATCLTRAEAAAIVARSCLIRMKARTVEFSPDGDGVDDTAVFDLSYLKNRGIASWQALIQDKNETAVCLLGPPNAAGTPPLTVTWNGQDSAGRDVAEGTYYYQAVVTDRAGRQFYSLRQSLELVRHSLCAYLEPAVCKDGRTLSVFANTHPGAAEVTATFADGHTRVLAPSDRDTCWRLNLVVGPFLPVGQQITVIKARFDNASREASLGFRREEQISLTPSLHPNPAAWGETVELGAVASAEVYAIEVNAIGCQASLAKTSGGTWLGEMIVPWGTAPGFYPVVFTARTASSMAEATVCLEVGLPNIAGLVYALTR